MDYSKLTTPDSYVCGNCGARGVKLWRLYQDMQPDLRCADCAAEEQHKTIKTLDETGKILSPTGRTDQIGWRIPAVPLADMDGYWGYTSVPEAGVRWWQALPNREP